MCAIGAPAEMLGPTLPPRMEQRHLLARLRVYVRLDSQLKAVAADTGQAQVIKVGGTTCRFGVMWSTSTTTTIACAVWQHS